MRIVDKGTAGRIDGYSLDLIKSESGADALNLRFCGSGGCFSSRKSIPLDSWTFVAVVVSDEVIHRHPNDSALVESSLFPTL
jgi:hypothetical protein